MNKNGLKLAALLLTMLFILVCLMGCQNQKYPYTEKEQKGREIVENYLAEYESASKIIATEAYIDFLIGGNWFLTDYVKGEYKDVDGIHEYIVNVKTGEIYSSKNFEAVQSAVGEYILEQLGLPQESVVTSIKISEFLLPNDKYEDERPKWSATCYLEKVVPMSVNDSTAFIENKEDRGPIYANCSIRVPDEEDISQFGLESMRLIPDTVIPCWLHIYNSMEEVEIYPRSYSDGSSTSYTPHSFYYRYEDLDMGDYTLRGSVIRRDEAIDSATGKIVTIAEEYDIEKDMCIEKTENGFSVRILTKKEPMPQLTLVVPEDSEYLNYKYAEIKVAGLWEQTFFEWQEICDGQWVLSLEDVLFVPRYINCGDNIVLTQYFSTDRDLVVYK